MDDALMFAKKQRPYIPAVYNPNRLKEKPLPNITQPIATVHDDEYLNRSDISVDSTRNENEIDTNNGAANASREFETDFNNYSIDTIEESSTTIPSTSTNTNHQTENTSCEIVTNNSNNGAIEKSISQEMETSNSTSAIERSSGSSTPIDRYFGLVNQSKEEMSNICVKEEGSVNLNSCDEDELLAILNYQENNESFSFDEYDDDFADEQENSLLFEKFGDDDDILVEKLTFYPQPIDNDFMVKANDIFCGNIPFKSFVSKIDIKYCVKIFYH